MNPMGPEQRLGAIEQFLAGFGEQFQRLRRQVAGVEATQRFQRMGRTPRMPIVFRSQNGEDVMLYALFGEQETGFYIEVGAHDGLQFSLSYAFDAMGWSGVLIEALPEPAAACRRNRPHARVVHSALIGPGGPAQITFTHTTGDPLFSYHTIASPHHENIVRQNGGVRRPVTVPATTMDAVLAEHTGPIDFASLDVEGGEPQLLAGFDLARHRPRVLLIEDGAEAAVSPVLAHMARQPEYAHVWSSPGNRVFIRRDNPDLIERFRLVMQGRA